MRYTEFLRRKADILHVGNRPIKLHEVKIPYNLWALYITKLINP